MIGLESLVQFLLHKYSKRATDYALDKFEERLWPAFRTWLQDRLNRSSAMTNTSIIAVNTQARFFKFISCEDGRILGGCMVAGDEEPGVYTEAMIQLFDGPEWSIHETFPDADAQEFIRRAVEHEIKEVFVVRPAAPVEFQA